MISSNYTDRNLFHSRIPKLESFSMCDRLQCSIISHLHRSTENCLLFEWWLFTRDEWLLSLVMVICYKSLYRCKVMCAQPVMWIQSTNNFWPLAHESSSCVFVCGFFSPGLSFSLNLFFFSVLFDCCSNNGYSTFYTRIVFKFIVDIQIN